jgi:hypothetical protein
MAIVFFATSAFAWGEQYEIKPKSYDTNSYGTDIEMRKKYDYDPTNKYRGTIDDNGSTRLRNYNGDTLRGHIDNDGYGRLRDQDGNTYRVRPR